MSDSQPDEQLHAQPSEEEINSFCAAARDGDNAAVAAYLDQYGPDFIDARDHIHMTALLWAAAGGSASTIQLLLEKGAAIEAKNEGGWTALMEAAIYGHEESVALLLEKGADIQAADDHKRTAQVWAEMSGCQGTAALLREWPEKQRQKEQRRQQEQREQDIAVTTAALVENRQQQLKQLRPVKPALQRKP